MMQAGVPDLGPAAQRILLGAQIRAAREARGLSTSRATEALEWRNAAKLSKIEAGTVPTSDRDLAALAELYEIPSEQAASLTQLAAEARRRLPPSRVPEWAARYVHLIRASEHLSLWNPDCFPGSVSTKEYARAWLSRSIVVSTAEVEQMVDERVARADHFRREGRPTLHLVVGEAALHVAAGGAATLRGQLEHVRDLAELPTVTVQVVPFERGGYAAPGSAYSIVHLFGEQRLVFVENLIGSDYLGREYVRIYGLAFEDLCRQAETPERTMEMITRRIREL
jgi:transcriptional regulator with XRE-family HTH domain